MSDILHTYVPRVKYNNVQGRPYVVVSAKGISNGLSDTYNDGADFGPDTKLGAMTPGQYGPSYSNTSGIQEAINYVRSFANPNTAFLPEIHLAPGLYTVHQPIYLKYTATNKPAEITQATNAAGTTNTSGVSAPILVGEGNWNEEGDGLTTPTGTFISAASDFPKGEYLFALLLPTSNPWISGAEGPFFVGGRLENITFWCNNLAAGVMLMQYADGFVSKIQINDPTTPNPVITQAPDSTGQSNQTGAFVYTAINGTDSGEFTLLEEIDIRGSAYEDGFVLNESNGILTGINLWMADGAQRYGFNLTGYYTYPLILINPESDMMSSPTWTGSVPVPGYSPQAAGYYIGGGTVYILNNSSFTGMPGNYPYVYSLGTLYINGGYYRAQGNEYVIKTSNTTIVVENATIEYNSSKNGVFQTTNPDSPNTGPQVFRNITYIDDNTGTPSYPPFSINWGNFYQWFTHLQADPFFDNRGRFYGGYPPSGPSSITSGTVYQNQNPTKVRIYLPVYATTSGTAGSVSVAMGNNQSNASPPSIPTIYTKFINGSTSSSAPEVVTVEVPAGWYYSFTGSGVTFGTPTVLPA